MEGDYLIGAFYKILTNEYVGKYSSTHNFLLT